MMHRLVILLLALPALLTPGCATAPPAEPDLPPLSAIRSESPPAPPRPLHSAPASRWAVNVLRLDLPLDVPLNELWSIVDEQAVPDLARAVWQANGLRIGVLDPQRLDQLDALLPAVIARSGFSYYNAAIPTPVRTSVRLQQPVTLNLTVPPMALEEARLDRGRLQLLMTQSDFRGGVALDLIPHHSTPRTSLMPRDPIERRLDGEVYEQLGVRLLLQPRQLAVVGLYWPWVDKADLPQPRNLFEEADPVDGEETRSTRPTIRSGDATEDPLPPIQAPTYRMPDLQRHFGSALLTGRRGQQPIQMLLLISLAPAPSPPSSP